MKRFFCLILTLSFLISAQLPPAAKADGAPSAPDEPLLLSEEYAAQSENAETPAEPVSIPEDDNAKSENAEAPALLEIEAAVPAGFASAVTPEATVGEARQLTATPGEPSPQEATPAETVPGEVTSGETVPGEATPAEPSPQEATPAETVPGEATPGEATPGEATPGEATPGEATPDEPTPSPLKLSAESVRINRSATLKLTVTFNGKSVSASKVKWKSSSASVASVSSGRVTAKKRGTAVITATYQGETAACSVVVLQPVTGVKLTPSAPQVAVGATVALKAAVSPSNADDPTLVWKSSNPAVATVDESGVVTGVAGGSATITATAFGGKSANVKVKVVEPVTNVVLPETAVVAVKKYVNLTAAVLPETATNRNITWSSSNKKIATVSKGRVTGVAGGVCVITAKAENGVLAQCAVTVIQPASSVKLSRTSAQLDVGKTLTLSAAVSPSTATDRTVVWRSSNPTAATVDENGVVTGVAGGSAKITAETANGKKAGCTVTVVQPVEEIALPEEISVNARASITLSPSVLPATATSKKLTWSTSDKRVATVSSAGKVTGVAGGECVVTAKAASGVTASVRVRVIQPVASVKLNKTALSVDIGASAALRATVSPATATDPAVAWCSGNPGIAIVDENGLVTGVAAGTTTITAQTANGRQHSAKVTVTYPVESVQLPAAATVAVKKSVTLKAAALPENASGRKITWSSDNPKIATVSSSGAVKGVSAGECVITAKTANGVFAECVVTVVQPVTSIKLSQTSASLNLYGSVRLTATVKPQNASDCKVVWKSSDASVAAVDENGLVTGVGGGSATISAVSSNGLKATCKVTVKEIKPASVNVDTIFVTLNPGSTHAVSASLSPSNASNPRLIFQSSNPNVATVDENGLVTGTGLGRATIRVYAEAKESVSASVTVSVIQQDAARLEGVVVGVNPGHQKSTIYRKYPIAPNSSKTAYGCKTGASGNYTGIPEYVTNREISLKLRDLLEEAGATVVMTRTEDDVSLTNIERAQMLNDARVDIALQVHCNSDGTPKSEGLSCYIRTTGDYVDESRDCAAALADEMSLATGAINLGVKICNTYMSLNWTTTPSVLLEMGYLSNKKEDMLLNDDAYQNLMAKGIFEGLCLYFKR